MSIASRYSNSIYYAIIILLIILFINEEDAMIYNFIFSIIMILSFWTIGRFTVIHVLRIKNDHFSLEFSYSVLGSVIIAIVASFLYFRCGLQMLSISWLLFVAAILVTIYQAFFYIRTNRNIGRAHNDVLFLGVQLILFLILIIPGLLYGEQYYVYRGNFFDQFIYLSEGLTAYTYTWPGLNAISNNIPNDVYQYGLTLLSGDRPPVTIVFSLLLAGKQGNLFFSAYLYHCMFLSMIFAPMYEFVKHITKKGYVAFVVSLCYILGFYGQIQYDINAWSHICSIGLFITNAYLFLIFFKDAYRNRNSIDGNRYIGDFRLLILMNIIMLGGMLYYVENWAIQLALSLGVVLIMCIIRRFKVSIMQIISVITIPITSFVFTFIACPQNLAFLLKQVNSSVGDKVDYGPYWYNWLQGFWTEEGIPTIAKLPALIVSIFGGSIYVPFWGKNRFVVFVWCSVLFVAFTLIVINIINRIAIVVRYYLNPSSEADIIPNQFITVWFIVSLILGILLYISAGHYGAMKYVLYVSPYIWIFGTISITDYFIDKDKRIIKLITCLSAAIILLSGVAMMGLRTLDTIKNDRCYGYVGSYPSDQNPGLKASHDFVFDVNNDAIKDANMVQIEAEYPFYLYYMKLSLLYAGKDYYSSENHVYYINDDVPMKVPGHIDASVVLEENSDGHMVPVYSK